MDEQGTATVNAEGFCLAFPLPLITGRRLAPWINCGLLEVMYIVVHCVSKMHHIWNGIAQYYKDQFWWHLAEIFKRL